MYALAGRGAAITFPLGAVLSVVSTIFDPPSREPEPRGMYVAYGADPAGADIAATILHYGFLFLGVGLLLAGVALASRRGRVLTALGGALGFLGFANLSGSVAEDWFDAQIAAAYGPDAAMAIAEKALGMPAMTAGWQIPMIVGFALGPVLLAAGLARGRVLPWWAVALPTISTVLFVAAHDLGPIGFLITLGLMFAFGLIMGRALWTAPAVGAQD
ncbi:hypothetical protein [Actinomycetospora termitidis]|uniref:DUF4386 family protein n=1 Tax=Actinomycetospora termitidis TaxID=3053470 RepID=A0ABT7MFJ4_9PSEU|nr:hypothetical protein [Actinomycetospora sp. Odt1-22]MDL5158742.1 hypothetical protein [Actinomycetospora sp. Odt1-22]